jgi:hypothetical protein
VFAALEQVRDDELSIVIQGPLFPGQVEGAERCVESVLAVAPDAEVILSTWETEDVRPFHGRVILVQSPDPGAFATRGRPYNLNRLLRSTQAGLNRASRPWCLKLRTDLALTDRRILRAAPARPRSRFARPLAMTNIFVRDPEKFTLLFHFSDIAQFGLTADLRVLWDGPLFSAAEVVDLSGTHAVTWDGIRLFPEQALTLRWLRSQGVDVNLRHPAAVTPRSLSLWADVLARDVQLVDWAASGIRFPERFASDPSVPNTLLSEDKAANLGVRRFRYSRVLGNSFLTRTLLSGRLAHILAWMRARFPMVNRFLRWLWSSYHGLRG